MKNRLLEIFEDPLREYAKLTDKQREAGRLASQGLFNDEIAEAMNTTILAVASLMRQIHYKTGMKKDGLVRNFIKQIKKAIQ